MAERNELQYDTRPLPWYARRRFRRAVLIVGIVAALALLWTFGGDVWRRFQLYTTQVSAATAPTFGDRVLLSTAAANPLAKPLDDLTNDHSRWWQATNSEWPSKMLGSPIFLQQRTSGTGRRRIVLVNASTSVPQPNAPASLVLEVLTYERRDPGWVFWRRGANLQGFSAANLHIRLKPGDQLDVYGGVADPVDLSHVTIPYVLNGKPDAFHLYLYQDPRTAPRREYGHIMLWEGGDILSRTYSSGGSNVFSRSDFDPTSRPMTPLADE